jgi:hypothetical protein
MIFAKVHERRGAAGSISRVVALCDADLIGKVFKKGSVELDLKKYARFYQGERVGAEEAAELARGADSVNAVGEKSVEAAGKALGKPGSGGGAKRVAGVPHLQIYRV